MIELFYILYSNFLVVFIYYLCIQAFFRNLNYTKLNSKTLLVTFFTSTPSLKQDVEVIVEVVTSALARKL
jgi:hypothetical protein